MSPPSTVTATRLRSLIGSLDGHRPAYRALAERIRVLIIDGQVIVGTRLPSERALMAALGMSRTTVTRAYAVLADTGYAVARQGSGTLAALPSKSARPGNGVALFPADPADDVIDLTCAATRAPAGVAEAYAAAVDALPAYLAGAGYFTLGLPELREEIAFGYTRRGLPTSPEEILVTSGAMVGMAIAARAFLRPGARVVIENPTYPNTAELLRRNGARLEAVPVGPSGWDIEGFLHTVESGTPQAAVLIPDFHNPTGAYMADEERAQLATALRRARTVTLIDETISAVRLDDGPDALPFAAHLPEAILVGSASKSHWGGLRLGWIRAQSTAITALIDARVTVDLGAPVVEQLTLLELLRQRPGIVADRRRELRVARDILTEAVRTALPEMDFTVPAGGLSLWLHSPRLMTSALVRAAEQQGLLLASGNRFATAGTLERWLRLPYVLPPDQLHEAVRRLALAQEAMDSTGATSTRGQRGSTGSGLSPRSRPRRPLVA